MRKTGLVLRVEELKNACKILSIKPYMRDNLGDLSTSEKIILK
jgi:hypothetical protein